MPNLSGLYFEVSSPTRSGIQKQKMIYYVYILASKKNGTLYIGVTNDLRRRGDEHKRGLIEGFTKKYSVHQMVYYESFANIDDAIRREKQLKKWNRAWKVQLIEKDNPMWRDLYDEFE